MRLAEREGTRNCIFLVPIRRSWRPAVEVHPRRQGSGTGAVRSRNSAAEYAVPMETLAPGEVMPNQEDVSIPPSPHSGNVGQMSRPWLDLYTPCSGNVLAERISSLRAQDPDADDSPLGLELWALVAQHVALADFQAICRLGSVCRGLRPISRLSQLWEPLCRQAFSTPGFRPCDELLRDYDHSWRRMFQQRKRLRFDGLYYVATTKLLHGLNEGRGMKEADRDFYSPGGRLVTSFRIIVFFPCGAMFSYLCSSHTPADIRKAASAIQPTRPTSLGQRLKGAFWGRYEVDERPTSGRVQSGGSRALDPDGRERGVTHITASFIMENPQYPNMTPTVVRYNLELRGSPPAQAAEYCPAAAAAPPSPAKSRAGANASLYLVGHSVESVVNGLPDTEALTPPSDPWVFLSYTGPLPVAAPMRPLAPRASGQ